MWKPTAICNHIALVNIRARLVGHINAAGPLDEFPTFVAFVYLLADRACVLVHVSVPAAVEEAGRDEAGGHVARRSVHYRLAGDETLIPHLYADVCAVDATPVMLLQIVDQSSL